jgi:nucleoside phosphorylase
VVKGRRGRARIAILTVVDHELTEVRLALQCMTNLPATAYWVREASTSRQYDVVLKQLADRGNIASGEGAKGIIEDFRPHYLLLVGIGGGIRKRDETDLGDVIVADYVDYYEFRKWSKGEDVARKLPLDHPSLLMRADIAKPMLDGGKWLSTISAQRPETGVCKGIVGNLITGDKLLADSSNAQQKAILDEYDKALLADMESCGVARAVFAARGSVHYNLQYGVIRGVSDLVDDVENNETRKLWRPYAAHTAARFAAGMVDVLLTLPK